MTRYCLTVKLRHSGELRTLDFSSALERALCLISWSHLIDVVNTFEIEGSTRSDAKTTAQSAD